MASTAAGFLKPSNQDWVIAKPALLNQTSPDTGIPVKGMQERIASYSHVFSKAGEYNVVFVAKNANYKNEEVIVKQIKVTIK